VLLTVVPGAPQAREGDPFSRRGEGRR
jgi:hypothetical protein